MVDQEKIKEAVRLLLEGIGEDVNREGLRETPERIARMYAEIFSGMDEDAAEHLSRVFTAETTGGMAPAGGAADVCRTLRPGTGGDGMVLEKDIVFYSSCEHHLMPFYGKAHVAYIPHGKVVGLSKLARTVEVYAKRPQLQERMTAEIADAIMEYLSPLGAMVLVEAEHMCMTMRGVKKPGSKTVSIAARGVFQDNAALQEQFFRMLEI